MKDEDCEQGQKAGNAPDFQGRARHSGRAVLRGRARGGQWSARPTHFGCLIQFVFHNSVLFVGEFQQQLFDFGKFTFPFHIPGPGAF